MHAPPSLPAQHAPLSGRRLPATLPAAHGMQQETKQQRPQPPGSAQQSVDDVLQRVGSAS